MNSISKKYRFSIVIPFLLVLLFVLPSTSSAVNVYHTYGVDANCDGECHGWYTNHFAARFYATDYPSNPTTHLETILFQATMTGPENQNNDEWTIYRLTAYSRGSHVIDDYSMIGDLRMEANSTYWQTLSKKLPLFKGNNQVDIVMAYLLKGPDKKTIEQRWYPIMRATNIN